MLTAERSGTDRSVLAVLGAAGGVWVAAVLAVAALGWLETDLPLPIPLAVAVAVPVTVLAGAFRLSERFRASVLALDHRLVLATQLWRVVGAAFLFGWVAGELPAGFAVPAGVGDVATGVAALVVLGALLRGTLTRARLWAFTALGLGDFVVAVILATALQPERLEQLPWALFPALAVPAFTALHLLALAQAARASRDPAAGHRRAP